ERSRRGPGASAGTRPAPVVASSAPGPGGGSTPWLVSEKSTVRPASRLSRSPRSSRAEPIPRPRSAGRTNAYASPRCSLLVRGRPTYRCATTSCTAGRAPSSARARAAAERRTTKRRFASYSWWSMPESTSRGRTARSSYPWVSSSISRATSATARYAHASGSSSEAGCGASTRAYPSGRTTGRDVPATLLMRSSVEARPRGCPRQYAGGGRTDGPAPWGDRAVRGSGPPVRPTPSGALAAREPRPDEHDDDRADEHGPPRAEVEELLGDVGVEH